MKRMISALFIAPLPMAFFGGLIAVFGFAPGEIATDRKSFVLTAICVGAAVGFSGLILLGLPLHRMLKLRAVRSWQAYAGSFFLTGLAAWAVAHVLMFLSSGMRFVVSYLMETLVLRPHIPVLIAGSFALVGFFFWAILRPDRVATGNQPKVD